MLSPTSNARPPIAMADGYDFRKQQTAFCVLNLFALGALLLLHTVFAYVIGEPSVPVVAVLGLSFALRLGELLWLQSKVRLTSQEAKADALASILALLLLAALLAWLTNRGHSPYQVLLAIPVLQSACLFGLVPTVLTILAADGTILLWLHHYYALHPQPSGGNYLEGGMLSVVLALSGILIWAFASILRSHQEALSVALGDLRTTRAQ